MKELNNNTSPIVHLHNGKITTTSLNIAKVFDKPHRVVTKAIRGLDIPQEFSLHNFVQSDFKTPRGKTYPMYEISRDGFTLLVMGFTGKKAMQFKLAYIQAFNDMEAELDSRLRGNDEQGRGNPSPASALALTQRLLELQEEMLDLFRFKVAALEKEPITTQKRRAFSDEENRILLEMWQSGASNRQIAQAIGRKVESVATKTRGLRLADKASRGVKTLSLRVDVQGELS